MILRETQLGFSKKKKHIRQKYNCASTEKKEKTQLCFCEKDGTVVVALKKEKKTQLPRPPPKKSRKHKPAERGLTGLAGARRGCFLLKKEKNDAAVSGKDQAVDQPPERETT